MRAGPQPPLGVLLVGGARTHQENYAALFASDPRARLIGLTDEEGVSPERRRWNLELAEALGVPHLESLDEALHRPDVHVVSVCVEKDRRGRIGAVSARAGKHVYMDKPIATSLEQGQELARAVAQSGVRSQMFSLVRTAWAARAREVIRSGILGELTALHCDILFAKGPAGTAPRQRRQERYPPERFTFVDSKRELFTTGVYSIGLIRWLSGRRLRQVYATTQNYFFAEHVKNEVEDFGAAVLKLDGGLTASITAGRIGWTSHPQGGPMRVQLVGTKGTALVDAYRPRIEVSGPGSSWQPPARNPEDPMAFWSSTTKRSGHVEKRSWVVPSLAEAQSDVSYFLDCILEGRESDLNVAEALTILEALFACYRSAASGEVVAL